MVAISRVDLYVNQTRLRGTFSEGGEVWRWFARRVTPFVMVEMRKAVAPHSKTGRLLRSLYARTVGTNQYLVHIDSGATADHAQYFVRETAHSYARQSMGVQSPLRYPNKYRATGGPNVFRIVGGGDFDNTGDGAVMVWADTGRDGYQGYNFVEESVESVLRRRRLL